MDELGKVDASTELLDKKVNTYVAEDAALDLADKTIKEELSIYLEEIKGIKGEAHKRILGAYDDHVKN